MKLPVNYQLLKNIAVSIGLPTYCSEVKQSEGREYPNLTVLIKADGTGYYAYLFPGIAEQAIATELIGDLERAFSSFGIEYRATGVVHIGGMKAYEYEIEA